MQRSGSSFIQRSGSSFLGRSSSQTKRRETARSTTRKPCNKHKHTLHFTLHNVEGISAYGDIVGVLEKTDGNVLVTRAITIDSSNCSASFHDEALTTSLSLVEVKTGVPGLVGLFKPNLIRLAIKLRDGTGATISSTFFNAADFVGVAPPGRKVRLELDSGASVFVTIAMVRDAAATPATSDSPTSVVLDAGGVHDGLGEKSPKFLKKVFKQRPFGSMRGMVAAASACKGWKDGGTWWRERGVQVADSGDARREWSVAETA